MRKKIEIKKLDREINNCRKCPLRKTAKKAVPGEGPASAKILLIGEAPGREEDLTGRPFVGRAGKLLDQLLKEAGIKREEIFITSVIKHRPPKNRKPATTEIKSCLPYLERQLKIINPRKIILLGGVAFSVFFPKEKLKDSKGRLIKKYGKEFFIVYHPAAGLRSTRTKKILEKDFKKIRESLKR